MTREQLVKQKTTLNNTLKALKKKVVQTPFANKIYENNIELLKKQIKQIEKELKKLIDNHPDFKNTVRFLDSNWLSLGSGRTAGIIRVTD